jgi:hypothetical protein
VSEFDAVATTEITLEGDGLFVLPACESDIQLFITDTFATLAVRTLVEGKDVHLTFDHAVLRQLRDQAADAIRSLDAASQNPVLTDTAEPLRLASAATSPRRAPD